MVCQEWPSWTGRREAHPTLSYDVPMVESTISHRTPLLAFGLFTGTLAVLFHFVVRSAAYAEDSEVLAAAITADLLLTVPLVYLLLARKYRLPYRLAAPLFIAMIFLAAPAGAGAFVMTIEMGGDPALASASIAISTALSTIGFSVVLALF